MGASPLDPRLGAVTVASRTGWPDSLIRLPRSNHEAFAALIGWGLVLHLLAQGSERSPWLLLAVAGAVTVAVRPGAVIGLTAVFVAVAGRTITDIDPPPGFWLFLALLAPAWLGVLYAGSMRYRGWPRMSELGPRFAPVCRVAFVAGWFVVVAHQLNNDFLDGAASCTFEIYGRSRDLLFFFPDMSGAQPGRLPLLVFAAESVIVLGLWISPLRRLAVAVALVFYIVAGAADPALGALAFGFLILFLPHDVVGTGLDQLAAIGHRRPRLASLTAIAGVAVMALAVLKVVAAVLFDVELFVDSPLGPAPFLAVAGTALTGLVLLVAYALGGFGPDPLTETDEPTEWIGPLALLMGLVVLALGAAPYIGLGTAYALADYSNLRTETGRGNHYLVPERAAVFDTQTPLLRVLDPAHPDLLGLDDNLSLALSQVEIVEGELSRRFSRACDGRSSSSTEPLTIARESIVTVIADPCDDPTLGQSGGWLQDRLLAYRPVPDGNLCTL